MLSDRSVHVNKMQGIDVDELRQQIAAREEKALRGRRSSLEEGNNIRQDLAMERAKLDRIKAKKNNELLNQALDEPVILRITHLN